MKIVGVFDHDELRVGNRLSGMKTYLVRKQEDLSGIFEEIEEDSSVRYSSI